MLKWWHLVIRCPAVAIFVCEIKYLHSNVTYAGLFIELSLSSVALYLFHHTVIVTFYSILTSLASPPFILH